MNESNPVAVAPTASHKSQPGRPNRGPDPRWQAAEELMAANASVDVNVTSVATSKESRPVGLNVSLNGLRAFLPGSLVPRGAKMQEMIGQTIKVKIVECKRGTLVVSLNAQRAEDAAAFVKTIDIGTEVSGNVVSVVDELGFFVNIGGVDALLHVSQTPLEDGTPKRFQVGDAVTARVSSINLETNKVGLTMRAPRPERSRNERNRDDDRRRDNRVRDDRRRDDVQHNRPTATTTVEAPVKKAVVTAPAKREVVVKPAAPMRPTSTPTPKARREGRKFDSFAELAAFLGGLQGGEQVAAEGATVPEGGAAQGNGGEVVEQKG